MLDNLTAATPADPMAIGNKNLKVLDANKSLIENNEKIVLNSNSNNNNTGTLTKLNKTKTILNWLKNSTTTTTNANTTTTNIIKSDIKLETKNNIEFNRNQLKDKEQNCAAAAAAEQPECAAENTASQLFQECTCPTLKQENNTRNRIKSGETTSAAFEQAAAASLKTRDHSLHEFRGVQTLKHLWNKRISANKESALRAGKSAKANQRHQFTKSVSCLVNASAETSPTSDTKTINSPATAKRLLASKKRAQSLYDCSSLEDSSFLADEIEEQNAEQEIFENLNFLTEIDIQKHLEKDNFYKYKTAEQALKLRELSESSSCKKLASTGIILPLVQATSSGCLKGERLHWLKRADIFLKRRSSASPSFSSTPVMAIGDSKNIKYNNLHHTANNRTDIIKTNYSDDADADDDSSLILTEVSNHESCPPPTTVSCCLYTTKEINSKDNNNMKDNQQQQLPKAVSQNELAASDDTSSSSTATLTAMNSPQRSISSNRVSGQEGSLLRKRTRLGSRDSSSNSLSTTSNSINRSNSGAVKRNSSTARRYSFKTHSRTYHHTPRKMHTTKEPNASGIAGTATANQQRYGMVAKLTQQFNELIQKDGKLLDEVKRKNGILMTRNGHVYKIVETTNLSKTTSPNLSRSSSRAAQEQEDVLAHEQASQNELSSDVQKTIRKFEIEAKHTKPKVPLKSNKVLKKSTELAMARYGSRHVKLNALSGQEQQKASKIAYGKVDKPQTLNLSSLEIVKEEAKTPLEEQEKMAMKEEAKISLEEVKITNETEAKTALQEDVVTMQEQTKIPLTGQNKSPLKENVTPLPEVKIPSKEVKIPLEKQFKSPLGEQIKSPLKEVKSPLEEVKTTSEGIKTPLPKVKIPMPEIKIPLPEIKFPLEDQQISLETNSAQHPENFESLKQLKSQTSFEFERVNSISLDYGKTPSPLAIEMGVDVVKEIPTTPTDAQAPQEQQEKLKQPLPFVESDNDDKQKQRKSKYAKIYEKIRFPLRNRKLASQNSAEELAKRKVEQLASSSENMSQDMEIFCSPEKIAEELYSAEKTRKDNKNKDSSEKTAKEIDLPKDKKNSSSPEKAAKENFFQKNKQKTYSPKKIAKANSIKIDKPETCSAEKTAAESKKKTCSPERNAKENHFQRDKPEESCSEEKKTEEFILQKDLKFSSPEKTAKENAFESAEHKADSLERTSIENVFQQSKQKSGLSQKTADESPLLKDKKNFSSPENKTKDKKNSSSAEENDFSKDDHKTGLPERIAKESREQSFGSSEKSAVLPIQENSISAELPLLPPKKFNIPAERNSVTHAYLPMANLTLSLAKPESDNEIYCKYEPNNPESNLLNSIDKVSRKIHDLTAEHNATIINTNTDYEKRLVSKSVLQTISEGLPPPVHITQAVNVTLVNAIEGEQMIMEQKQIQREAEEMANKENVNETKAIDIPEQKEEKEEEEESFYEPIDFLPSEIAASSQTIEEDIYQSVDEVKYSCKQDISSTPQRLNDYESIEQEILSTKITQLKSTGKIAFFDGYEECAPPPIELASTAAAAAPPPPVPPPMVIVRKTTDVLPELPAPKRILTKSPMLNRPIPEPPKSEKSVITTPLSRATDSCIYYDGDDENIYDTIRGSNCYESLQSMGLGSKLQSANQPAHSKNHDSLSLSSNCYESITQYRFRVTTSSSSHTIGNQSTHSSSNGSTLTISSENKTNSLYEDSLNSSLHYYSGSKRRSTQSEIDIKKSIDLNGNCNGALYSVGVCASLGRSSDNSDEWTDVSDNEYGAGGAGGRNKEAADNKPQFIVVRERSRCHKSPDWSRRVRDKRLHHQRKSNSCIEDDSEPDYEPLSPKRHSMCIQNRTASLQRNQETVRVSRRGKKYSFSAQALGQHISDDSFDSDTDEVYEAVHSKLNNTHNDSGVDVRTQKLPATPAPPSSSSANQMYSIVKKFKNFIVNKKSPNSSKNNSQQTIYDTSSQFYVNGHMESNKQQQQQQQKLSFSAQSQLQVPPSNKDLSSSEKNLIMAQNSETPPSAPQRNGKHKSIRSRLRKSIVGSDSKNLAALSTVHRSTFYIDDPGIYSYDNNGEMDSGFSEKPTSVDLVNNSKNTSNDVPTQENQKFSTVARKSKKESKMANSQRRRTTIGIRPHEPPPPPPPDSNGNEIDVAAKQQQRVSSTSWYAECGVFKNGTTNLVNDDSQLLSNTTNSQTNINGNTASWYEEAGLYQTSGLSVASGSSGSSGVSTGNETGPGDEMSHSMFCNEPLYQMYSAAKLEALSCDLRDGGNSTDGYEEIGSHKKDDHASEENHRKYSRPSALQLVEPKSGPERTLWSQIPEVINSCIIPTMTPREKAFMEAKFEIITSEASYLKSLNLLRSHYMNHPVFRDSNVVSSRDRKSLFAHIVPVHECSEKLLSEMESCWQDNIMLLGLSKRIYAIAEKHFHVYVGFCEQQGRMDRTLKRLRQQTKGLFSQNLELLESSSVCCGLNLHSFLMLPMQRITRLPLLIDAAFSKCQPNDDEYDSWKMCLAIMNKVVTQCNEAANRSEQSYEIEKISGQLEFNSAVIRPLAIKPAGVPVPGSKPRYLVKRGELTHLVWRGDDAKLTFGKKFTKSNIYAFLFSDLLVLTKRKGEEHFSVFDYCPRNMLTLTSGDALPQLPTKDLNSQSSKNLILMTLLENHERKTVELLLSCPSVSEQERWLQAMRPPEAETPGEKLYEQWDCPQVVTTHKYAANEPDALDLEVGDVVNVSRKLPDGWYQGERIRDGVIGWFPGSYTVEVNSVHVRSRNLKQRHRLLTFTATYLESQKRYK